MSLSRHRAALLARVSVLALTLSQVPATVGAVLAYNEPPDLANYKEDATLLAPLGLGVNTVTGRVDRTFYDDDRGDAFRFTLPADA